MIRLLLSTDCFLERPADKPAGPSCSKRSAVSKQGNVTASVRVAEFGKAKFYADSDNGKLFCRACNFVIDYIIMGFPREVLRTSRKFVVLPLSVQGLRPGKGCSRGPRLRYKIQRVCRDEVAGGILDGDKGIGLKRS